MLNVLRLFVVGYRGGSSLCEKRFVVGCDPVKYFGQILVL